MLMHLIANKEVYSNWFSPEQFGLELKAKNIRLMRDRLGLPERYKPGTFQAGASASRVIESDLDPFLVIKETPLTAQVTNLNDLYFMNDFYTDESISPEIISQQELSGRIRHPIRIANAKYPYAINISKGLKVYPDTISKITVNYYRKPLTPTFLTTVDVNGDLVYNPSSVELEWKDENKLDILHLILEDVGVNIERQEVSALAQKLVEGGK